MQKAAAQAAAFCICSADGGVECLDLEGERPMEFQANNQGTRMHGVRNSPHPIEKFSAQYNSGEAPGEKKSAQLIYL